MCITEQLCQTVISLVLMWLLPVCVLPGMVVIWQQVCSDIKRTAHDY